MSRKKSETDIEAMIDGFKSEYCDILGKKVQCDAADWRVALDALCTVVDAIALRPLAEQQAYMNALQSRTHYGKRNLDSLLKEARCKPRERATPNIKSAIETRNFLPVCAAIFAGSGEKEENVAKAAKENGMENELAEAQALAPYAVASVVAVKEAGNRIARDVFADMSCSITIQKTSNKITYTVEACSPIIVMALGSNRQGENPHLKLKIQNVEGEWNDLLLPRVALFNGTWLTLLADKGARFGDAETARLILSNVEPSNLFGVLEHAGWNGGRYVLPSGKIYGADASDEFVATFPTNAAFGVGGRRELAGEMLRHCESNTRLMLAVEAALAAACLEGLGAEPGGFHFYGASSGGKTSTLCIGASVVGKGAEQKNGGHVGSWNSTAYAAEKIAGMHSDCLLCVDEMRQMTPEAFQKTAYSYANGIGKAAGSKDGSLRERPTFRPMVLSTGEASTKDYIESGYGLSYDAGMSVRLVDVPADAGVGLGIFDYVPGGFTSAADFADYLKRTAAEHYGHHGDAFFELLAARRDAVLRTVGRLRDHIHKRLLKQCGGDAQSGRVAQRFSMTAAVGYFCAVHGLLPWKPTSTLKTADRLMADWLRARGGKGSGEALAGLRRFNEAWMRHRERFKRLGDKYHTPHDTLGATRVLKNFREIWIADDQALAEILGQAQRVQPFLDYLDDGLSDDWELVKESDGRRQRSAPKGYELPKRMYCIRSKGLVPDDGVTDDDGRPTPPLNIPSHRGESQTLQ